MGFIGGTKDKPSPLSDKEAKGIMQQLEQGSDITKPKISFEPGEMVRVVDGPFNDFSGVVEEVNYEKSKVRVAVLIFGRSTPVELQFNQNRERDNGKSNYYLYKTSSPCRCSFS